VYLALDIIDKLGEEGFVLKLFVVLLGELTLTCTTLAPYDDKLRFGELGQDIAGKRFLQAVGFTSMSSVEYF